jgi:two-component system, OmpR family, alkaline phosphatase synthesis response regulator PhoP
MKVLVVEDDKFLMSAYRAKLERSGYEVHMASDGDEALSVLETLVPDIILLDLVMPRKDGFATLGEIRQKDALKSVPVIVASNLGQKEDIDKATGLGATDYIIKSDLSMDDLIGKIEKVTGKKA